jgi:hypothetical protein
MVIDPFSTPLVRLLLRLRVSNVGRSPEYPSLLTGDEVEEEFPLTSGIIGGCFSSQEQVAKQYR